MPKCYGCGYVGLLRTLDHTRQHFTLLHQRVLDRCRTATPSEERYWREASSAMREMMLIAREPTMTYAQLDLIFRLPYAGTKFRLSPGHGGALGGVRSDSHTGGQVT